MIYLDHMASTPIDPTVEQAMLHALNEHASNPHALHQGGVEALSAIDRAAGQIADAINADASEITFTSGASEANNAALKGVAFAAAGQGKHLIVSALEHACILEAANWLSENGFEVTVVPSSPSGLIDPSDVFQALRDDTVLVSVQLANNEVGTVQPVAEIASRCRQRGITVHSDAAQAFGKIPIDVAALGVDLMSLSAHKVHGPQGIGALWIAADCPVRPTPLIHGGSQQRGRRAGTVPTFLCVGFGVAAGQLQQRGLLESTDIARLTALFWDLLNQGLPDTVENAAASRKLPGCLSVRFPGAEAIDVLDHLRATVAASTGAACSAGSAQPSHVLTAMGLGAEAAREVIRFGLGHGTTEDEVRRAAKLIIDAVHSARRMAA